MSRKLFYSLLTVFTLSGFTGLVYESIWTHYLKLYLGHAAYAQTLVLSIFMGGMAIGAWLCSRLSHRWRNVVLYYAIIEAIIGISAIVFHGVYIEFLQLAFNTIIPSLANSNLITLFKWLSAALLILPQSILLGMTFPLLASGFIRHLPQQHGKVIASLYFCNSIGASVGVLVSGFLLIRWVGLPGTIMFAGIVNVLLALIVWRLVSADYHVPQAIVENSQPDHARLKSRKTWLLMLSIALLTGMASFIYEVVWIRMLSLVLGASTHAFELMLSAFILGLALGGGWVRKRIDILKQPRRFLAYVQLVMGGLALLTIPLYSATFDVMQWLVRNLDKTDSGYWLFNLSSHLIAFAVMLPATFCAGMTLPLITHLLYKSSASEKHIGHVYAANTVGAIIGVLLTVHLLMPGLGLKLALSAGAVIDIFLGLALLYSLRGEIKTRKSIIFASVSVSILIMTAWMPFDSYKMASGVFRYGEFYDAQSADLLFHKDGKTASVDMVRIKANGEVSIITNGKPDASINMLPTGQPSPDEATMTIAAAIPLAIKPDSRHAAIIGLGSGFTTHALLSAQVLEQVETIEIEESIVEAAQGFRPRVEHAYSHPAGQIHIEDAKTFFSTHNRSYDIIISEPSNPWVSGIASLFTDEFYALIKRHMVEDGVFVQWMQLYEIDVRLVASVIKAIENQFANYAIYAANNNDLIIVATKSSRPLELHASVFEYPELANLLYRLNIRHTQDLQLRYLGDKTLLSALFNSFAIDMNSDYYPVLDLNAVKARFMQKNAMRLIDLRRDPFRNWQAMDLSGQESSETETQPTNITPSRFYLPSDLSYAAILIRDYMVHNRLSPQLTKLNEQMRRNIHIVKSQLIDCHASQHSNENDNMQILADSLQSVAQAVNPFLSSDELLQLWQRVRVSNCYSGQPVLIQQWIGLLEALALADYTALAQVAKTLLADPMPQRQRAFVLHAGLLANFALNNLDGAQTMWAQNRDSATLDPQYEYVSRMLLANALRGNN